MIRVPVTERARRYGYVTWPKSMDDEMRRELGDLLLVPVTFDGNFLGEKRIDWKFRRISIGRKRTSSLSAEAQVFEAQLGRDGALAVKSGRA